MYIKDYYHDKMVRITYPEDKTIGSEIMHILLDTLPPTNIIGVYQETGITNEEADEAHRVLKIKVIKRVEKGQVCLIMGDKNAPINKSSKPFIKSAKKTLWSGKK